MPLLVSSFQGQILQLIPMSPFPALNYSKRDALTSSPPTALSIVPFGTLFNLHD